MLIGRCNAAVHRKWFRTIGQLWYEVFDMHVNLSPEKIAETLETNKDVQMILAMHPHGIVPYQAILWAAYCDQYFRGDGSALYGFGAAADAVGYVPFLRNVMGFLTAGSASYKPLKEGLTKVSRSHPPLPHRRRLNSFFRHCSTKSQRRGTGS